MQPGKVVSITEVAILKKFPQPTFHRVMVSPMEEQQEGLIHIPETVRGKATQGRVVAVGPGRRNDKGDTIPVAFKVGQEVVFNRYAATEIKYMGKLYLIIAEDEIAVFYDL